MGYYDYISHSRYTIKPLDILGCRNPYIFWHLLGEDSFITITGQHQPHGSNRISSTALKRDFSGVLGGLKKIYQSYQNKTGASLKEKWFHTR